MNACLTFKYFGDLKESRVHSGLIEICMCVNEHNTITVCAFTVMLNILFCWFVGLILNSILTLTDNAEGPSFR